MCGHRYRTSIRAHLDHDVGPHLPGVSRCDFNLVCWRVDRAVAKLESAGFSRASQWANTVKSLAPDLAFRAVAGQKPDAGGYYVGGFLSSSWWPLCWWSPRWVVDIVSVPGVDAATRLWVAGALHRSDAADRDAFVSTIRSVRTLGGHTGTVFKDMAADLRRVVL